MDTTVPASADDTLTSQGEAGALWNPIAAALWSLLLTPAFGAWLHMRNWERLGQPDKARQSRWWFSAMLLVFLATSGLAAAGALLRREDLPVPWWAGLLVFGVWCALSAYPQIKHVDERRGEDYARRAWLGPILLGLAANVAIPFLTVVVLIYREAGGYGPF